MLIFSNVMRAPDVFLLLFAAGLTVLLIMIIRSAPPAAEDPYQRWNSMQGTDPLPDWFRPIVDGIDWKRLDHAYGQATKMPWLLVDLFDPDEQRRANAVYDGLWSAAYHQGSTYSVTPVVVDCVLSMLLLPESEGAADAALEMMRFVERCADARALTARSADLAAIAERHPGEIAAIAARLRPRAILK